MPPFNLLTPLLIFKLCLIEPNINELFFLILIICLWLVYILLQVSSTIQAQPQGQLSFQQDLFQLCLIFILLLLIGFSLVRQLIRLHMYQRQPESKVKVNQQPSRH